MCMCVETKVASKIKISFVKKQNFPKISIILKWMSFFVRCRENIFFNFQGCRWYRLSKIHIISLGPQYLPS
eukprot:UN15691